MSVIGFDALIREADVRRPLVSIVVAGGADRTVLEAMRIASDRGWIVPVIAGNADAIKREAKTAHVDLSGFRIVDTDGPAMAAVEEVRTGRCRALMKGQIATPELLRAVLDPEFGLRTGRTIAQVVLMELVRDRRTFLMADTGIMIRPNLAKKVDLLEQTVALAHALGADTPHVAMLAATEKPAVSMPDTLHAAEIQRRSETGEFGSCMVQGPLSFDLAYAVDAAGKKHVEGSVVGAADVMLFPDLVSANLTVKAIMYTADSRFGGVLCGAACPIAFMSRADTTETRLNSLALCLRLITGRP